MRTDFFIRRLAGGLFDTFQTPYGGTFQTPYGEPYLTPGGGSLSDTQEWPELESGSDTPQWSYSQAPHGDPTLGRGWLVRGGASHMRMPPSTSQRSETRWPYQ